MSCIRKRAPKSSSAAVRHVMQENVGRETHPERRLRSLLFRSGLRFRKDYSPVPSERISVDVLFPRQRICIFVDGCFWHGCPLHFKVPKTHSSWWQEKIADNRQRDARQTRLLTALGWTVIRMWEHEIKEDSISSKVREIKELVQQMAAPDGRKRRAHR